MKTVRKGSAVKRILFALIALFANGASADEGAMIARVEHIYVRAAEGVLAERGAAVAGRQDQLWAEVRIARENGGGTRMLRLDQDISTEPGDLVQVKLARPGRISLRMQVAPMPEVSRAIAVAARRDTEMARAFDAPTEPANPLLALVTGRTRH